MTTVDVQGTLPIDDVLPWATTRRMAPPLEVQRRMEKWGATEIFDLYWQFAIRRQEVFVRRMAGFAPPWTSDGIIARHRFTNPYRYSDRVSQYLIGKVQHDKQRDITTTVFRTLLFKLFNRIDTWASLTEEIGEATIRSFDVGRYDLALSSLRRAGRRIYSPAYIVPNPPMGADAKHTNHLRLLASLLDRGVVDQLAGSDSLHDLYYLLREVPSFGPFLAFQYAVDINYTEATSDDESQFVVAGPGAVGGLRKCFSSLPAGAEVDAIMWVVETQENHFARLGLEFPFLLGRRLQPVDCQNLFCEIDKYSRASHPHFSESGQRARIKQLFKATARQPLPPLFVPPKWERL